MRTAVDTSQNQPAFAMFSCQLDSSLTLIGRDLQLTNLLGSAPSEQASDRLTSYICANQADSIYQKISNQLSIGEDAEFIFPIHGADGGIRWLLGRGQRNFHADLGTDCLSGVLVDVTNLKNEYDKHNHIVEQHRIILEQTGQVMFEWDILGDTITFSEDWKSKFGYVPQTNHFTEAITQGKHVHPEDAQHLLRHLAIMQEGRAFLDLEIRIAATQDQWLWCKIRACGIYDTFRKLTHVIGLIVDIDDEKKAHRALQAQAEQDSLTKLLNAHTTRLLAEQYLHTDTDQTHCAMLILDLDDFKRLNDQHGHLCGDEILIRVSNILKHSFRADDIVGRIGGEEFLVLMKNVSKPQKIIERCSHLLEAIRASSPAYNLTASIGVSIVAGEKTRYDELFQRTDEALYQAKRAGKNRFALCE